MSICHYDPREILVWHHLGASEEVEVAEAGHGEDRGGQQGVQSPHPAVGQSTAVNVQHSTEVRGLTWPPAAGTPHAYPPPSPPPPE